MSVLSEQSKSKGFTLVELLVIISIIAILAVVGVTVFSNVQKSTRDAKRKGDIRALYNAIQQHYYKYGSYTQPETLCTDTSNGRGSDANGCGTNGGGDWDANSNLRILVTDSMMQSLPKDPINNTTYYYYYEPSNPDEPNLGDQMGSHYLLCANSLETTATQYCLNDWSN